jgi:prepilin-type N-terminal cleavage/methylation domain-containing protein
MVAVDRGSRRRSRELEELDLRAEHADELAMSRGRAGFTLVELMVVIVILAVLAGMTMSILNIGRSAARRTVTESILHKVETGLKLFKTDFKAYPFQAHYPDLGIGDANGRRRLSGTTWTNRLYYHIGTDIADDDRGKVMADMDAAGNLFAYNCWTWWGGVGENYPPASVHTFVSDRHNGRLRDNEWGWDDGDDAPTGSYYRNYAQRWFFNYENPTCVCTILNRMAAERARLIMLIGDVEETGVKMTDIPGGAGTLLHQGRDLSAVPLLQPGNRQSASKPGWAVDYLKGELESRFIDGETILDGYHHPIIYICQVKPGVRTSIANPYGQAVGVWVPEWYGLTPSGRSTLSPGVAADADALPDPSNLMHSDITLTAAPGYELEFELWSAGPDGKFTYMRDDRENRDNIPCDRDYLKGLRQ